MPKFRSDFAHLFDEKFMTQRKEKTASLFLADGFHFTNYVLPMPGH